MKPTRSVPLFNETQMRAYGLAWLLFERDKWRKVLAESCADERSQMWEAGPGGGCSRAVTAEADVNKLRAALAACHTELRFMQCLYECDLHELEDGRVQALRDALAAGDAALGPNVRANRTEEA
jgi:hypothetical protein